MENAEGTLDVLTKNKVKELKHKRKCIILPGNGCTNVKQLMW